MKLLLTNDWHFASKTPASRTDDYNEELFGLLAKLGQLTRHVVKQEGFCALLHAGDWFHDKGRVPWPTFARLAGWLSQEWAHGATVLTVPGNHDMVHDRYDSLPDTPFGALKNGLLIRDISREVYWLEAFIETGVVDRVGVYGVPWPDAAQPDAFQNIPTDASVVVAHCFATPEGGEQWGCFCHKYDDLARAAPHVRLWHFGHDHSDNSVHTLKNGAQVVNIGALSRGALDHDNLTRKVKTALVTIEPGKPVKVQQVDLDAARVSDIFDLNLRAQQKAEREQIDAFVARLHETGLTAVLDVDYRQVLGSLPLEEAVRQKALEYIERAESVS